MFTAALFTTAGTWKQPKCSSTEAWIKKMWYVYTTGYYPAIKKNETTDLEIIILCEISQQRKTDCTILLIYRIQKNDTDELICKAEIESQM